MAKEVFKKWLHHDKLDLALRKILVKCYGWRVLFYEPASQSLIKREKNKTEPVNFLFGGGWRE